MCHFPPRHRVRISYLLAHNTSFAGHSAVSWFQLLGRSRLGDLHNEWKITPSLSAAPSRTARTYVPLISSSHTRLKSLRVKINIHVNSSKTANNYGSTTAGRFPGERKKKQSTKNASQYRQSQSIDRSPILDIYLCS